MHAFERVAFFWGETKSGQIRQKPVDAGEHAVASPARQAPGVHLEHGVSRCGTAFDGGIQHGEFVPVGK